MKKITLLISCLGLLSLASCKKDRTCNCTTTTVNGNSSNVRTDNITLTKSTKADAKDACSNSSTTNTSGGSTYTSKSDCKLS